MEFFDGCINRNYPQMRTMLFVCNSSSFMYNTRGRSMIGYGYVCVVI